MISGSEDAVPGGSSAGSYSLFIIKKYTIRCEGKMQVLGLRDQLS